MVFLTIFCNIKKNPSHFGRFVLYFGYRRKKNRVCALFFALLSLLLQQISTTGCLNTWAEIIPKNLIRVMPA